MSELSLIVDGRWEGEYSYLPSEEMRIILPKVRFVLNAQAEAAGIFSGVIEDDLALGCPTPAQVSGRFHGNRIWFQKQYSQLYCCDETGSLPVSEFLAREYGLHVHQEFAAPPIDYEGQYSESEQIISGTWRMPWTQIRFEYQGNRIEQDFPALHGKWMMRRDHHYIL